MQVRMCRLWSAVLSVALIVTITSVGYGSTNLPWTEDFEGFSHDEALDGTNGWETTGASVVATTNEAYSPTKSGYVPQDQSATNVYEDTPAVTHRIVVDMYAIPDLWDGSDTNRHVDQSAAALFYFNSNGYAVIHEEWGGSTNWQVVGSAANAVQTGAWNRVTVFQNYSNQTWALFVRGLLVGYEKTFVDDTITSFSNFEVEDNAYIDNVRVEKTYPSGTSGNPELIDDTDDDGVYDMYEIFYNDNLSLDLSADDDGDDQTALEEFGHRSDPFTSDAIWDIPYFTDFESAAANEFNDNSYRGMTSAGSVSIAGSGVEDGSAQSVGIATGSVSLALVDAKNTNVWVQMYIKPIALDDTPGALGSNQTVGICLLTDGSLHAYSGSDWTQCNEVAGLPTNDWLGISAHLHYNTTKWDLFVTTNGFESVMSRAHSSALDFNAIATNNGLTGLVVTNNSASTMYADVIAVSDGTTDTSGTSSNTAPPTRWSGRYAMIAVPYKYPSGQDALDEQLGTDLAAYVLDGDKIRIFKDGWQSYKLNSGAWQSDGATIAPSNMVVTPTMGIWLRRMGGTDIAAFFQGDPAGTYTQKLFGAATYNGWNFLAVPLNVTADAGNDFGIATGLGTGDFASKYQNGSYYELWYDGSSWRNGRDVVSSYTMTGDWWYKRTGSGSVTNVWNGN